MNKHWQNLRAPREKKVHLFLSRQLLKRYQYAMRPRYAHDRAIWRNGRHHRFYAQHFSGKPMYVWRGTFADEWLVEGLTANGMIYTMARRLYYFQMKMWFPDHQVVAHINWLNEHAPGWKTIYRNDKYFIKFKNKDAAILYKLSF